VSQSNKSIFLRSIDQPAIASQYTDHKAETTVARFSPSGYYVASGDASGMVNVWDCVGEGITKGEYSIVHGRINDLAWDGDSQRIIAVGSGKQRFGHCITADSGNTVGEITGHSQSINSVSIRQQRPIRAAAGGDDKTLVFYHGTPFKYTNGFRENHSNYIYGTAFSPDGSTLASVGTDRRVWLYDGKTGEPRREIGQNEHNGSIFAVSWSADSRKFVTASADRTVKVWDAEYGKVIQAWAVGPVDSASVPHQQVGVVWPCGRTDGLIISLSLSGDLNYFAEGTPNPTRLIQGHQSNITSLTRSETDNRETLWTGSSDGRVCAWDVADGTATAMEGDGHTGYISGIAADRSSGCIYSVGWDDTVRSANMHSKSYTGKATKLSSQPKSMVKGDSAILVANSDSVEIFREGTKVGDFGPGFQVTTLAASGSLAAIGGEDSTIQICAITNSGMKATHAVKASRNPVTALAFSEDASVLAAGDSRGRIVVINVADGKVVTDRWTSHTARVTSLSWDQGDRLASGSLDTSVFIWSLARLGDYRQISNAHKEGVNSVAWVSDGTQVASAGADAAVKFWPVERL
jgi:WD40 repeat protein